MYTREKRPVWVFTTSGASDIGEVIIGCVFSGREVRSSGSRVMHIVGKRLQAMYAVMVIR